MMKKVLLAAALAASIGSVAVTASAVSHRISALEEELEAVLFVRHTRRVEVTPEGERLAAGVRRALAEIKRAVASIDRRNGARLRISAIPSHVTRWLAPRLHRFQRQRGQPAGGRHADLCGELHDAGNGRWH